MRSDRALDKCVQQGVLQKLASVGWVNDRESFAVGSQRHEHGLADPSLDPSAVSLNTRSVPGVLQTLGRIVERFSPEK